LLEEGVAGTLGFIAVLGIEGGGFFVLGWFTKPSLV